jgi:hypothetical protein
MARFLRPKPIGLYRYGSDGLDGDLMNLSFADPVPEAMRIFGSDFYGPRDVYGGGARVSARNMPTKLRFTGRKRRLVDFDGQQHMYLVTRRFIDIVEGFQKEVQYFPVECSWADGSPAGQFFFFFTTVLLDAVIREKTTATWTPIRPDKGLWQPSGGQAFAFDKSRLGNTHMWVDPNMPTEGALITEALHDALKDAKIQSFYEWTYSEEI